MENRRIYFEEQKIGGKKLYTIASILGDGVVTTEKDSITGRATHVILNLKTLKEIVSNAETGIEVEVPQ